MKQDNKLILFDIDGTLIKARQQGVEYWKLRLREVFDSVYHTPITFEINVHDYNGMLDKKVMHTIARKLGVADDRFHAGFPQAREVFHTYLKQAIHAKKIRYDAIADAKKLVGMLSSYPHISYGVVTGNIEANGWLKLESAGMQEQFTFGMFADEWEERALLVEAAVEKATKHFSRTFAKTEVVVVGDTVHDIRAAMAAGVMSIGVTTGLSNTADHLMAEGADLVVPSLMDERVLTLLGLGDERKRRPLKRHVK